MRRYVLCFIVVLYGIASCAPVPQASSTKPTLLLTDCVLSFQGVEYQVDARCGTLPVPENPSQPQGRQIPLNIAVVPAIKRASEPDPLVVLVGGPGQAAVELFPVMYATLFRVHQARDIVLVDQRGTGKSNPLRCLEPEDKILDDARAIALLKSCPRKLDADLRYYTTDIAMQDLDAIRAALGYERVNLYGVSYGTRAALVYLKMYPERVRSMVLDAVVDPAFVIYQDVAQDGERALELFFERCEADEFCHSAYPDLEVEFDALLQRLQETPVTTVLPHPTMGRPLEVTITSSTLANTVFSTLYTPELLATLPLAIHQAYVDDNFSPLITLSFLADTGIYDGMFYAVACTEDAQFLSSDISDAGLFGRNEQVFKDICSVWPKGKASPVVHAPVSSDKPVLLLSGEADPITPPWHADLLAEQLSNEAHLIFTGMGHGNASNQCGAKIVASFIENPSTKDLDTGCVETVKPPQFFVDFSGPQP
ncbi:MAG: alpha/beta hydrolase [Anaerolineales bacterium]|nr:alpha/beta hydrolase [Anaerolineae bacterium]PWB68674.1 MAG: alpha/beta hydrolase [Anaerolineales bacterium]